MPRQARPAIRRQEQQQSLLNLLQNDPALMLFGVSASWAAIACITQIFLSETNLTLNMYATGANFVVLAANTSQIKRPGSMNKIVMSNFVIAASLVCTIVTTLNSETLRSIGAPDLGLTPWLVSTLLVVHFGATMMNAAISHSNLAFFFKEGWNALAQDQPQAQRRHNHAM